ncbi:ABC transporter ATP-binding protein [Tundrisphaera lichenicola]|uniref:ABC transporter ATP-binding protein n=1 Tax=Tundrisphaera lichenicola TaxID=2029860 RepID=UPI003EBE613C
MPAAAFDRVRKLRAPRQGAVIRANVLGLVHSALVLATLLVVGALADLMIEKGQAWRAPTSKVSAPEWLGRPVATRTDGQVLIGGSGLYPIVAKNLDSPHLAHRLTARLVSRFLRVMPTLRNNSGALMTLLAVGLGIFFALSLVAQALKAATTAVSLEVATNLRRQIHRQLYRLGQSSLPSEGTGPVMNLFTREVNDVREGIATELEQSIRIPSIVVGLLVLSLMVSWSSTLALATLVSLVWLMVRHLNRSAELASVVATRESALQLCLLQEDFSMIRTVRVHGMENVDKLRFDEHLERYRDADSRRIANEARSNPTSALLISATATLAIGLLAYGVIVKGYSAAAAILQLAALLGLIRPSFDWLKLKRTIRQATRSAEGIFGYLERKPELLQTGGATFLPPIRERISFENVSLSDGSGRVLLDGLTVEIPARSKTSIMSLDEEAKTALACLIPRLIDPKVGRVRIDGLDLRDVTLESIRAQVATVLQADLVFSDSVLANIALGDPSYDLPRVIEAAKVAHAHHFIQDLPNGYDTVIGPLGAYLKPDQQYRVALARAYLHDPSILIIEEPDIVLDDDTKAYVDDTVARLTPGRTLIMLPHRLSTIRSSEHVIVIHNGRLEVSGPPREVNSASKLYRHLQYVEFNQFAAGEIEAGQMGV